MASEHQGRPASADGRAIGLVGTLGRVLLGIVFLGATVVFGTNGGLQ